jgi:hypothetical protein
MQIEEEIEMQRRSLRPCRIRDCGCDGNGSCGRLIALDGSVLPIRDTGFRMRTLLLNMANLKTGKP